MTKHIHIHLGNKTKDARDLNRFSSSNKGDSRDANPDGTVSPDEDKREAELKAKIQGFAMNVKREAYDIGGSFRGPGIYARMLTVMSKKV